MKIFCFSYNNQVFHGVCDQKFAYKIETSIFDDNIKVSADEKIKLSDCDLLNPIIPGKVVAIAQNYKSTKELPKDFEPIVFIKSANTICASSKKIKLPNQLKTWGEPELGFVIKKKAFNIAFENALDYILGFITSNDITCSNVLGRDHHLARSKSMDNFCPIGDYIDINYDFRSKMVCSYHNDLLLRKGSTSEMFWGPEKIVSELSKWMTLEEGDIILTGAPNRVRDRQYLLPGDRFRVEIEGFPPLISDFYD